MKISFIPKRYESFNLISPFILRPIQPNKTRKKRKNVSRIRNETNVDPNNMHKLKPVEKENVLFYSRSPRLSRTLHIQKEAKA
jgi:hypothetical protein